MTSASVLTECVLPSAPSVVRSGDYYLFETDSEEEEEEEEKKDDEPPKKSAFQVTSSSSSVLPSVSNKCCHPEITG